MPKTNDEITENIGEPILNEIDGFQLVYSSDRIKGYRRKKWGKGFIYLDPAGERVKEPEIIARIKDLVIPPAWEKVWISPFPNGHIQATGRDAKGRKQYIYHEEWDKIRDLTKYGNMVEFGNSLPKIRDRVDRDLRKHDLPREKVLALVVYLLDRTHLRVGNIAYVKQNKSYGLTTLEDRHVEVSGSRISIVFSGKRGKRQAVDFASRRLAALVRRCQDLPGQRLFQYVDDSKGLGVIDSADVNEYLKEIAEKDITAKDFRTWGGTVLAAEELNEWIAETRSARQKLIPKVVKKVAKKLGNTPAVCRKYYIHPAIFETFEKGTLPRFFDQVQENDSNGTDYLSKTEEAVLSALEAAKK